MSPTSIRLDSVKRFLNRNKWKLTQDSDESVLVYEGPRDDFDKPIKLILPAREEEFSDANRVITRAIRLLSDLEQCSVEEIEQTIANLGSDFLRQRIITATNHSTISLSMATQVVNHLRDLVYYSACLEEDMQPFFARGRNIGKKFLEKCRFGQTFIGSFGLLLEMPISLPSENPDLMPLERRIMVRIAHGMLSIRRAVEKAEPSILSHDYHHGFNANLYETMLNLVEAIQDSQLEFSFCWSPEYSLPEELKVMTPVRFIPETVSPFLEGAAKVLRRSSESQDTVIVGQIVQLRVDSKISDDETEELEAFCRIIIIEWETEKGKLALIRASLSPQEYKEACDAHRDGKKISIRGKPEKLGKYLILTSPVAFKVLND